ncbi:MAG TPA: hypothetical protein DCM26_01315 [Desulfotomaculum sp.]|nr:hypothetical protein [Desulfotomaculum sp.]
MNNHFSKGGLFTIVVSVLCLALAFVYLFYLPRHLQALSVDIESLAGGKDTELFSFTPDENTGQTFISRQSNLCRVEALLGNVNFQNKALLFHLKEDPEDINDLVTVPLAVSSLMTMRYGNFLAVNFPVQRNSKDKQYYFYIEVQQEAKQSKVEKECLILYSIADRYREGTRYVNHKPVQGDLVFKTRYLAPVGVSE